MVNGEVYWGQSVAQASACASLGKHDFQNKSPKFKGMLLLNKINKFRLN
jgi:hypothetical protein